MPSCRRLRSAGRVVYSNPCPPNRRSVWSPIGNHMREEQWVLRRVFYRFPLYEMRQIVPPVSSPTRSEPSFATASAAGRRHTSARLSPDAQEAGGEVFVVSEWFSILEGDEHHLVAGWLRSTPGALQ